MNPFHYSISLRLRHPTMDPKDITKALGMQPQFKWMVGERRATPKGELLKGVNTFSYWCSQGIKGEGFDLAGSLSSQLLILEARKSFLADFVSTGGSIDYFVAWFADGLNTSVTLDWQLLKRLSALQIDLGLDVYGGKSPAGAPTEDGGDTAGSTKAEAAVIAADGKS